ncbi:hypothetical protein [Sphingomonas sp. 1185]|uniref:hypothetical protein n=1 Tax=Sphingomonas sp. 1185 TaxID=3156411 RepID=UPI003397A34E
MTFTPAPFSLSEVEGHGISVAKPRTPGVRFDFAQRERMGEVRSDVEGQWS